MDNKTGYCRNPQCALYGHMAPYARAPLRRSLLGRVWCVDATPTAGDPQPLPSSSPLSAARLVLGHRGARAKAWSGHPRYHTRGLRHSRPGRSSAPGVASQEDHQHLRRRAQQPGSAPTCAPARAEGPRLLQRVGLPRASTHPRLCLLSLRCPPPQLTATPAPQPPDERPERLAEEVEASDPSHGRWADRPCVDHG
jgi:hypothetical protein